MSDAQTGSATNAEPGERWRRAGAALWRIALWLLMLSALTIVVMALLGPLEPALGRFALATLAQCLATLAATAIMLRLVDRQPWAALYMGRHAWRLRALLVGTLLGVLAIGLPVAALLATGWLAVEPAPDASWWGASGRVLLILVPAALGEELLARGYLFQRLREVTGGGWALVGTSAGFALLHLANPGVSARALLVVFLAGLFLGAVLLVARSLWAAWLAHLAWNVTLAVGLHATLSGATLEAPDYRLVERGPDWVTGGAWGPEGGAGAMLGLAAAVGYLIARRSRREEL